MSKINTETLLRLKINEMSTMSIGCYNKNFEHELKKATKNKPKENIIKEEQEKLFNLYENTYFLYPAKKDRISSYMDLIKKNWRLALKMGDRLLTIIKFTGNSQEHEQETTISFWRTTLNSWIAQHLCSTGFPVGVCAMMLKAQAEVNFKSDRYKSFQNWFSSENRFAQSVFGTLVKTIGEEYSNIELFNYIGLNSINYLPSNHIFIVQYEHSMHQELYNFYCRIRGKQDAEAEEFDEDDIELDQLDEIYQTVSLRRKRFVWLAYMKNKAQPIGVAVANRGPFGLNFSLIENRCDLLIDPSLSTEDRRIVCHNLLSKVSNDYFENDHNLCYPINYIPVVADEQSASILLESDAVLLRQYNKSVWLRGGFESWYEHIRNKYASYFETMKDRIKN
jgi:hypothetical protein